MRVLLQQIDGNGRIGVNLASASVRSYRILLGGRLALEIRGEPGALVSASVPPPPPGAPPVTHPFATASFRMAETEGELGVLLREASDLDAFLVAAERAGYRIESVT